jgi:hypothetical protein
MVVFQEEGALKELYLFKNLLLLALVLAAAGPVWADSPNGTISFEVDSFLEWSPRASLPATEMGISWVQGVLSFEGKPHTFKMKGLKTSIPGVRRLSGIGDVYNLKAAVDLAGTYHKAAPAGSTSIGGEKVLVIKNDKGVVIKIRVTKKRLVGVMRTIGEALKQEGVPLDLMPGGLTIEQVQ